MNDREILTAALRWSTAFEDRKEIGSKKRLFEKHLKGFGDSQFKPQSSTYQHTSWLRRAASDAALQLTIARKRERAAMRDLAKVCAKVRIGQRHVADADVIDVRAFLTYEITERDDHDN
jgi:hypothetical protein